MKIYNEEQLRKIYGFAQGRSKSKQLSKLEKHSVNFIEHSPFVVISTANGDGKLDCSPRGGDRGFVQILDDRTLLVPDSKGNNRLDSFINILSNPHVGCLFLIPGIDETLRVNGKAELRTDDELVAKFDLKGKRPKCVIKITTEEVFLHCAKALMRSSLWSPEIVIPRSSLPSMGQMINDQIGDPTEPESHEAMVDRYNRDL